MKLKKKYSLQEISKAYKCVIKGDPTVEFDSVCSLTNSKKKSLDQSDEIFKLKNLQHNLMNNVILRGVKKIPKVLLRKSVNQLKFSEGNYEKEDA